MIPVITPEQARAADAASPVPIGELIARAGSAVAGAAIRLMGGTYGRTVVVIAGPGNNGADGRHAGRLLAEHGCRVITVSTDALMRSIDDIVGPATGGADLVIDAAFGTGFRGSWSPPDVGDVPVLAVDVPSGLDAISGRAGAVLPAALTVTFQAAKPGHLMGDGPRLAGRLEVVDIGLALGEPHAMLATDDDVAAWLPQREITAHKWSVAVHLVAGSESMAGAGILSARGAFRAGAGMVRWSHPGPVVIDPIEAVHERLPASDWAASVLDDVHRFGALIIGPGLGRRGEVPAEAASLIFGSSLPVVVDGDGLFALTWNPHGSPASLRSRTGPVVLTPHDGEYATLLGDGPGDDRIAAANRLVAETGAVVLLKGPTTVVAGPDGRTWLVDAGDQRLATAGSGDVLSGVIGAFLASGMSATTAAVAGAHVHGLAGQRCALGATASDISAAVPLVLSELTAGRGS